MNIKKMAVAVGVSYAAGALTNEIMKHSSLPAAARPVVNVLAAAAVGALVGTR